MTPSPAQRLSWDWSDAALGAACALPAAVVMFSNRTYGLALAIGVLPAAILGLAPRRRARLATLAAGALTAASLFVGGALAGVSVVAVAALALLGVGAVLLAARAPLGQVAMFLSLPLVGIGLSFDGAGKAAPVAGLMLAGSVFAYLVALIFPESGAPASPRPPTAPLTLEYGIRLGGAGATAAALGFLLDSTTWAGRAAPHCSSCARAARCCGSGAWGGWPRSLSALWRGAPCRASAPRRACTPRWWCWRCQPPRQPTAAAGT